MSPSELENSEVYQKNITFKKGENYLIKANSGRGKSTLLNIIYATTSQYVGSVHYGDESQFYDEITLRQNHLSYVFQDLKLFDNLSVLDNIVLKNNLTQHKRISEIETWLISIQLQHKKNELVKNLSLGQKQRVAILRALCQPFDFLLLDEPFSHIDEETSKILTKVIGEEVRQQKAGLIITTLNNDYFFEYKQILTL